MKTNRHSVCVPTDLRPQISTYRRTQKNPEFSNSVSNLGAVLTIPEKEDIAVMLLKIVAADGRKDAEEMEKLRVAADMISIPEDVMHRAFDRYFEETQVLPDEDS